MCKGELLTRKQKGNKMNIEHEMRMNQVRIDRENKEIQDGIKLLAILTSMGLAMMVLITMILF